MPDRVLRISVYETRMADRAAVPTQTQARYSVWINMLASLSSSEPCRDNSAQAAKAKQMIFDSDQAASPCPKGNRSCHRP